MTSEIQNLAIIGCGQVGTSILLAMSQSGKTLPTIIFDKNRQTETLVRKKFEQEGFDSSHLTFVKSIKAAVAKKGALADLIILATPMDKFESAAKEIAAHAKDGAILTDTGSAKQSCSEMISEGIRGTLLKYVAAHPSNGGQGSGPSTGNAMNILGQNSTMFLIHENGKNHTPAAGSAEGIVQIFWKDRGVITEFITAEKHDKFFGQCSHFQHPLQFVLLKLAESDPEIMHNYMHAGTAFRNMTRIAIGTIQKDGSSDLVNMFNPIFRQNSEAIIEAAHRFHAHFDQFISQVHNNTPESFKKLEDMLTRAKQYRDSFNDNERREIVTGEINDLRAIPEFNPREKGQLTAKFKSKSLSALSTNLLLPIALSYAQVMSAHEIDPEFISSKANPSFRDGTHPSTYSVKYVVELIRLQAQALVDLSEKYIDELDNAMCAIDDWSLEKTKKLMITAQTIRNQIPPPRKGDVVRAEYERIPA